MGGLQATGILRPVATQVERLCVMIRLTTEDDNGLHVLL